MKETSCLRGLRIFVVEDESFVFWMIEDILNDLGCVVNNSASTIPDALRVLTEADYDLALLDVNVAGEKVFPVAEALSKRSIPFAFLTGYGVEGVREAFREHPILAKPFTSQTLSDVLLAAINRA